MPESYQPRPLREQLEDRVAVRLRNQNKITPEDAATQARQAVDAYYENRSGYYHELVAYEAVQIFVGIIPPFATALTQAWTSIVHVYQQASDAAMDALEMLDKARDPVRHLRNTKLEIDLMDGKGWQDITGKTNVSFTFTPTGDFMKAGEFLTELTENQFYAAVAKHLKELDCTYVELKTMAEDNGGNFATAQHHTLWYAIGGDHIDRRKIARAEYLAKFGPDDFGPQSQDVGMIDVEYPTDTITGWPDHYIVNGDTSSCACLKHRAGHAVGCETWQTSNHPVSLCNIPRTNCGHHPRHGYGQECDMDQETECE